MRAQAARRRYDGDLEDELLQDLECGPADTPAERAAKLPVLKLSGRSVWKLHWNGSDVSCNGLAIRRVGLVSLEELDLKSRTFRATSGASLRASLRGAGTATASRSGRAGGPSSWSAISWSARQPGPSREPQEAYGALETCQHLLGSFRTFAVGHNLSHFGRARGSLLITRSR